MAAFQLVRLLVDQFQMTIRLMSAIAVLLTLFVASGAEAAKKSGRSCSKTLTPANDDSWHEQPNLESLKDVHHLRYLGRKPLITIEDDGYSLAHWDNGAETLFQFPRGRSLHLNIIKVFVFSPQTALVLLHDRSLQIVALEQDEPNAFLHELRGRKFPKQKNLTNWNALRIGNSQEIRISRNGEYKVVNLKRSRH